MKEKFEYIIFDLGGVLIQLVGPAKMAAWLNGEMTQDEFNEKWLLSPSVREFERGATTAAEFSESIIREFGLPITAEEFTCEFLHFIEGFFEGIEELLKKLGQTYSLACLSNTNELHWDKVCKQHNLESLIPHNFLSYRMGLVKPDPEIFVHVIQELQCEAGRILYFDDNPINVAAAKKAGITAFRVCGYAELSNALEELEVI